MLLLALALVACALGLQELQVDAMGRAGDAEAQARVLHAGGPGLGRAGDAEAQARVLQAGGPGLLTLHIPFAGSLAPIWGNLALPPGSAAQPAQYKLCVYLESIAAGQALYNGPKPQENADSYAPILADGSFLFVGWFANYALDPVTPFIIGHAFPNSLGQCLPILGTPANAAYPGLMNAQSIAYASLARVNTLSLALAAGSPFSDDTAGSFALTIQGIPPDPIDFMVLVYCQWAEALARPSAAAPVLTAHPPHSLPTALSLPQSPLTAAPPSAAQRLTAALAPPLSPTAMARSPYPWGLRWWACPTSTLCWCLPQSPSAPRPCSSWAR